MSDRMTDLTIYQPNSIVHAPSASTAATIAVGDRIEHLRAWAQAYAAIAEFAAEIVETPFVPAAFRPQIPPRATAEDIAEARRVAVATAAAAIVYGSTLGFEDPITSLQNVYVINGRPALSADAMVAITLAAGHQMWVEDLSDSRAVVCGRRKGSPAIERVEVTIDAAKRAGWTRNAKYASDPQSMLYARAAARVCRRIAQDALKGIGPSIEEAADGDDTTAVESSRTVVSRAAAPELGAPPAEQAKPKPARTPRKKAAAPAAGPVSHRPEGEDGPPPLPGEDGPAEAAGQPADATPPLPGEERASGEQLQAIGSGFAQLGIPSHPVPG